MPLCEYSSYAQQDMLIRNESEEAARLSINRVIFCAPLICLVVDFSGEYMSVIHKVLGALILFFDWVFTPRTIQREVDVQAAMDEKVAGTILYQYKACPFCVKVRRSMKRNGLKFETRDAKRSEEARDQLVAGGGKLKVPCLRAEEENEVRWIYDSSDIIDYLQNRIAA